MTTKNTLVSNSVAVFEDGFKKAFEITHSSALDCDIKSTYVSVQAHHTAIDAINAFIASTGRGLTSVLSINEVDEDGRKTYKTKAIKVTLDFLDIIQNLSSCTTLYYSGNGSTIILDLSEYEYLVSEKEDAAVKDYLDLISDACLKVGIDLNALIESGNSHLELHN